MHVLHHKQYRIDHSVNFNLKSPKRVIHESLLDLPRLKIFLFIYTLENTNLRISLVYIYIHTSHKYFTVTRNHMSHWERHACFQAWKCINKYINDVTKDTEIRWRCSHSNFISITHENVETKISFNYVCAYVVNYLRCSPK